MSPNFVEITTLGFFLLNVSGALMVWNVAIETGGHLLPGEYVGWDPLSYFLDTSKTKKNLILAKNVGVEAPQCFLNSCSK